MNRLIINCGSASIKIKIFDDLQEVLVLNLKKYEVGDKWVGDIRYLFDDSLFENLETETEIKEYLVEVLQRLRGIEKYKFEEIIYRIVHGGTKYSQKIDLSKDIIEDLVQNFRSIAPIHNPFTFDLINLFRREFRECKHTGMFDTNFFMDIPIENFLYAIPHIYYEKYGIRKFGFHGFSHKYIALEVQKLTNKKDTKIVSCHLGSGNSVCAINGINPVDNSFGFTPEENIMGATRCGEIDYSAVAYLKQKEELSDSDLDQIINFQSGLFGLSGYSKDMKKLLSDYNHNDRAKIAIDIFVGMVAKQIVQMILSLRGIDILIFTGGIGVGSDIIREMVVQKLAFLNIKIDDTKNKKEIDVNRNLKISSDSSIAEIWVIPTNEELQILREVLL